MKDSDYLGTFEGLLYDGTVGIDNGKMYDASEIINQLKKGQVFGELLLPGTQSNGNGDINLKDIAFTISDFKVTDCSISVIGVILNTPMGRLTNELLCDDEPMALSVRGISEDNDSLRCDLSYDKFINGKYDKSHKIKYRVKKSYGGI